MEKGIGEKSDLNERGQWRKHFKCFPVFKKYVEGLKSRIKRWIKRQTFINPYLGNRIKGRVCLGEETWRRGRWWLWILAEMSVITGVTLWSGPERECVDGGQVCGRVTLSCTWGVGGTSDDFFRAAGSRGWSSQHRSEPQGQLWESEWIRSQQGLRLAVRQSLWGLRSLSLQSQAGQ